MIVGQQKPFSEIKGMLKGYKKVLIAGCGTCVTVTFGGGRKETTILATSLRIAAHAEKSELEIREDVVPRQCEARFLERLKDNIKWAEAVLSLACGVGVQTLAETYPRIRVLPGLNTSFIGRHFEGGIFQEYCGACGDCILAKTTGICPIVRCAKSLLNGPCGGSQGGKCEVSKDTDCAWQLIYDRLKELNLLDRWEIWPPKDWSTSWHGGPRKLVKEIGEA
ncbi:MAG: methylenetetrahydrofolate reductase C-terminal domain-containing protein [Actinomycetota bacterium]|nr:methylenetetrahydrofolate reductase C-terminal domain-containing protein [Actinomycetota bacterium]